MTSCEVETFKGHNFENVGSLLKVKNNWWLVENLVAKKDDVDRVYRFETI